MLHTNGVIWRILTGSATGVDKDKLLNLTEKMLNVIRNLDPSAPTSLLQMNSLTFTKCLKYFGLPNFIDSHRDIAEYLNAEVENSHANKEGNYVERALSYRDKCIKLGRENFLTGPDGRSYLTGHLIDLFFAGTETTSSTMEWMLLYVVKFQTCQERMFEEVSAITDGNSRKIELADKSKAHYCNAFITEVMRHCPIGSFSVPHKTVADTTLGDREIPKGTQVINY